MSESEKRCRDCVYFDRYTPDKDRGECHRSPPVITGGADAFNLGCWPEILGDKWCGEFKRKSRAVGI